ncbi:MAG: hypothetical protein LBR06_06850 [Bacteroidales bacterium]|jgi:hypothetical protein|nr:hypothetical protein [Bacteroidales bacterium]
MKKYLIISLLCAFAACSKTDEIDRTIFVPDTSDSNLPAYSEWGYNSFGAKYDRRSYFLASNSYVPCKIIYKDDSLRVSFIGELNGDKATLTFAFALSSPVADISDLVVLRPATDGPDGNEYSISGAAGKGCTINMVKETVTYPSGYNSQPLTSVENINFIDGSITFKRIQKLRVDERDERVILSGTFEAKRLNSSSGFPEALTDGRFDIGMSENDFIAIP